MAAQTEFVLRSDGFWYAPPMDPNDDLDHTVRFGKILGPGDMIDGILAVSAINITVYTYDFNGQEVTVWLKDAVNKKTASVTVWVRSVGGRKVERTFKIDVAHM